MNPHSWVESGRLVESAMTQNGGRLVRSDDGDEFLPKHA
jgi:hypothetical protein